MSSEAPKAMDLDFNLDMLIQGSNPKISATKDPDIKKDDLSLGHSLIVNKSESKESI